MTDARALIHLMVTQDRLIAMSYNMEDIRRRFIAAELELPEYSFKKIKDCLGDLQDHVHSALEKA